MWHKATNFFSSLEDKRLQDFLESYDYVWDALDHIESFISDVIEPNVAPIRKLQGGFVPIPVAIYQGVPITLGITYDYRDKDQRFHVFHEGKELLDASLILPGAFLADDNIEIGGGVLVESGTMIIGPTILGKYTTVRHSAYIRGGVFTTSNSLIGHCTEAKNVIMMDEAKAGHFAYLGDSIIGSQVNLGAGTKLANLKITTLPYHFRVDGIDLEVKKRKFGAILGDGVASGCNCVTNPGTLMGQNCRIMPNTTVKAGYHGPMSVISSKVF
ncbi:MAG: glucose-1-phosphate thymidylyltransferase [Deltaproteobacteria bacterium]|jgi:NDP-sugar pyrophosphorylase family protein|nr:glucose-1-phosphate thymidylyltransferase [Deltaproteobacteria bacterium]